jgi:hypothetical protein
MRKRIWLWLWIAGILFPMAWLGRFSTGFRRAFDALFGPLWVHILMHAGLFAVLGILIGAQLRRKKNGLRLALFAMLLVGLLQEGLQSLSAGRILPAGSLFDLGIDLAGGLIGVAIIHAQRFFPRME